MFDAITDIDDELIGKKIKNQSLEEKVLGLVLV